MSESDMLESYLYNNFNLELSEVNGILRCSSISWILNSQKKNKKSTFNPQDIIFSKLLSKFSIQHQNYKSHMNMNHKLQITNYFQDNFELYRVIIKKMILSMNQKNLNTSLHYLITKYELKLDDLEKISKLIKIKIKKTKREDELTKISKVEIDKKYITKFGKLFNIQ